MLTVKYERKDFWGRRQYTEDNLEHYGRDDIKKAFLFLGKIDMLPCKKKTLFTVGIVQQIMTTGL